MTGKELAPLPKEAFEPDYDVLLRMMGDVRRALESYL